MNEEIQMTHSEPVEEPKAPKQKTEKSAIEKEVAALKKKVANLEKVLGL